jgi:hypothetical protein
MTVRKRAGLIVPALLDAPLGNAMTAMFFSDLEHSVEIKLDTFARRPFTERMWEASANLPSRLL